MKTARPYTIEWPVTEETVYQIQKNFETLFSAEVDISDSDDVGDSVLGVPNGGTGLSSVDIGDLLYGSAADVLSTLAIGNAGSVLRSNGTTPDWSTFTIPNTFATGDLIYGSAANVLTALAAGTAGMFLKQGASIPEWANITTADISDFAHDLLSAEHSDTVASAVSRGSIVVGNSTPAWAELVVGANETYLRSDGTDAAWSALLIGDFPLGGTWALTSALTLSGAGLLFSADNTHDIGASGATRPRDLFVGRNTDIDGTLDVAGVSTLRANLLFSADASHDIGAAGATRPRDVYLSRDLTVGDQIFERGRTTALGEWITPTFAAGDYTASAGNWTVASGDIVNVSYTLIGKTMTITIQVQTTTTSSTPATLRYAIPGGFTAAKQVVNTSCRIIDNTGPAVYYAGVMYVTAGGTTVNIQRIDDTGIPALTDVLIVQGTLTFEVS